MLSKGLAYEQIAEKYLRTQGLKSITNNYRSKFGEIDLIMG
ncbi:YraN family protein, partial [Oleiphilus sp. HI0132]